MSLKFVKCTCAAEQFPWVSTKVGVHWSGDKYPIGRQKCRSVPGALFSLLGPNPDRLRFGLHQSSWAPAWVSLSVLVHGGYCSLISRTEAGIQGLECLLGCAHSVCVSHRAVSGGTLRPWGMGDTAQAALQGDPDRAAHNQGS